MCYFFFLVRKNKSILNRNSPIYIFHSWENFFHIKIPINNSCNILSNWKKLFTSQCAKWARRWSFSIFLCIYVYTNEWDEWHTNENFFFQCTIKCHECYNCLSRWRRSKKEKKYKDWWLLLSDIFHIFRD